MRNFLIITAAMVAAITLAAGCKTRIPPSRVLDDNHIKVDESSLAASNSEPAPPAPADTCGGNDNIGSYNRLQSRVEELRKAFENCDADTILKLSDPDMEEFRKQELIDTWQKNKKNFTELNIIIKFEAEISSHTKKHASVKYITTVVFPNGQTKFSTATTTWSYIDGEWYTLDLGN